MINFSIMGWKLDFNNQNLRREIVKAFRVPVNGVIGNNMAVTTSDDSIWQALCAFAADESSPLFICEETQQMFFGVVLACWDQSVTQTFVVESDISDGASKLVELGGKLASLGGLKPSFISGCLIQPGT